MSDRDLLPGGIMGTTDIDRATESVRVWCAQGTLCTVNFDAGELMVPDIEASNHRSDGSVGEVQDASNMGGRVDGDAGAVEWLAGDDTFWEGDLGRAGNALDRSHHGDEGGEIVWPHIKKRASAGLIEKVRVRMPSFGAVPHHKGGCCYWFADSTLVNQFNAGLEATTEESVGGTANTQVFLAGQLQESLPLGTVERERFFSVDRFSGFKGGHTDLGMGRRDGEVENHIDVWVG